MKVKAMKNKGFIKIVLLIVMLIAAGSIVYGMLDVIPISQSDSADSASDVLAE